MASKVRRFLVPAYGYDPVAVQKALRLIKLLCEESSNRRITIVCSTKDQIDGTSLSEALGPAVSKALSQGKLVTAWNNSTIGYATERTFKPYSQHDIILVAYASKGVLKAVESSTNINAIVAFPWLLSGIEEWEAMWNPVRIENDLPEGMTLPERQGPASQSLDPIAVEALKWLTGIINVSTGLSHPLDKGRGVMVFRALKKAKIAHDVTAIKSWAVQNGWAQRHADILGDLAQKISDGKSVQAPDATPLSKEWLKKMRERAEEALLPRLQ